MSRIEDRLKKLQKAIDPKKGKTEYTIKDATKKPGMDALKTERKTQQTYKSVKLKTETYDRLQKIIDANELDSIGRVIDQLLTDWCDQNG